MSRGGRGRGRGRGKAFGGNLEVLGFTPGESAPPPILQPPPLYPTLDRKPLPLNSTELDDYLLTVKQDLRQHMKQSPFHLKIGSDRVEIKRYSDKYQSERNGEGERGLNLTLDWKCFPEELQSRPRKKRVNKAKVEVMSKTDLKKGKLKNIQKKRPSESNDSTIWSSDGGKSDNDADSSTLTPKPKKAKQVSFTLEKTFEQLEKSEKIESEQSADEEAGPEEVYDEEIEEEGTDYNLTYFDNGEDYEAGDDDALEEGPIY